MLSRFVGSLNKGNKGLGRFEVACALHSSFGQFPSFPYLGLSHFQHVHMYLKGCLLFINKNYSDFIHSSEIKQILFGSLRTLLNLSDFRGIHLDLSINNP